MLPEEKNSSSDIKELMEKIKENSGSVEYTAKNDGSVEFDFSPKLPKTGLVFEEDNGEEEVAGVVTEEPDLSLKEASEPEKEVLSPVEEPRAEEEFEIPESFVLSEEFDTRLPDEQTPMIWKTYVPRFTEVTERQYRLRDETSSVSRPREEVRAASPSVKVEQIDPVTGIRADVADPTSEHVEEGASDAVIVNINGKTKDASDSISVFKFPKNDIRETAIPDEEELERAGVMALLDRERQSDQPASEEAHTDVSDENTDVPTVDENANKPYSITDEQLLPGVNEPSNDTVEESDLSEGEEPEGAFASVSASEMKSTKEFNSGVMREHFKDKFLDTMISIRLRMIVAIIIGVAALAFENLFLFNIDVCKMLGIGGSLVARAALDLAFVVALMIISIPEFIRAFAAIKKKRVVPELSLAVSALFIILYTVVVALNPVSNYPLFAFVYSVMVISAIYATYCLQSASFCAFKLIADNDKKIVLDNRLTRTLEKENMALDGAVDEYDSRIARSFETTFVSDFFERSSRISEDGKNNSLVLALAAGIALVTGAVMFFIGGGAISAFSSATLVISLGLPAFAILSHKLTYNTIQKGSVKNDCAVIGEQTYGEYAAVDVIAFEDSEIFGVEDVVLKSISLNDKDGDFRKVMRRMTSLFASLGGPLYRMFKNSIGKTFEPATDMTVEADGASGRTDGVMIMAGTLEYMERHGIRIPYETPSIASTKTMYAAENGVLFAKFSIQYSFSEEFAMLLPSLRERGIVPLIYTRDPNVTNDLMRFLTGGADVIRVMRRYNRIPAEKKVYRRLSSGAVTLSDKLAAINIVLLAKRYERMQYGMSLTELAACAVGAALAAAISVCNMILYMPSVLLGVWQIAWCAALAVISAKTFGHPHQKKRKDK